MKYIKVYENLNEPATEVLIDYLLKSEIDSSKISIVTSKEGVDIYYKYGNIFRVKLEWLTTATGDKLKYYSLWINGNKFAAPNYKLEELWNKLNNTYREFWDNINKYNL